VRTVNLWLRLELRRRWRSLVVLALLVALASGTVLASVAGARRGDSSVERLRARTLPADAVVLPNQPGFDWDRIRALPEVTALTTFLVTEVPVEGLTEGADGFPPGDADGMKTIERPVMLKGRVADPTRVDEVVVSAYFVSNYHKGVGDSLTLHLYTPQQIDAALASGDYPAPRGPRIKAHIVGVVRSPFFVDQVGNKGGMSPSAAVFARYRANLLGTHETAKDGVYINALVRLNGGESALPAWSRTNPGPEERAGSGDRLSPRQSDSGAGWRHLLLKIRRTERSTSLNRSGLLKNALTLLGRGTS